MEITKGGGPKQRTASKAWELINAISHLPEIINSTVPEHLQYRRSDDRNESRDRDRDFKNNKNSRTKNYNHQKSSSTKKLEKKPIDDILLDYCVYMEHTHFDATHPQLSRVCFITQDKNLYLKAAAKFKDCSNPRPHVLSDIKDLEFLFEDG